MSEVNAIITYKGENWIYIFKNRIKPIGQCASLHHIWSNAIIEILYKMIIDAKISAGYLSFVVSGQYLLSFM